MAGAKQNFEDATLYLQKLIRQGEHQNLDFKLEIDDARKIARAMCAFANADGGILLIGVKDNGVVAGIRSEEELYMLQAAAEYYTKPKIKYSVKLLNTNKKTVLEAYIPVSENTPHYVQNEKNEWKAYVRVNDQNIILDSFAVHILKQKKEQKSVLLTYGDDEYKVLTLLQNSNKITFQEIERNTLLPYQVVKKIITDLILLKIAEYTITLNGTFFSLSKRFAMDDYLNQKI